MTHLERGDLEEQREVYGKEEDFKYRARGITVLSLLLPHTVVIVRLGIEKKGFAYLRDLLSFFPQTPGKKQQLPVGSVVCVREKLSENVVNSGIIYFLCFLSKTMSYYK